MALVNFELIIWEVVLKLDQDLSQHLIFNEWQPSAVPPSTQEQELATLIGQLRLVLEQTIPDLDHRVSANREDLVRLGETVTALDERTMALRTDRKNVVTAQEATRQSFDRRLTRHRADIDGLKKKLSGDVDTPLSDLRVLHSQTKPLLTRLQTLAEGATPDPAAQERLERHAAAIFNMQTHLLGLTQLARTLEDNVGRRLRVAQSDPRRLTLSCGEYLDRLNATDSHLRAAINGFSGALQERDRVLNDKTFHPGFHTISLTELKKLSQQGFLPPEFKDLGTKYAALYARANTAELQDLLRDVVFIAAQYPEMVLKALQNVFDGMYVTIDQDLLEQFAHDINFFFHSMLGLDCKMIPDGNTGVTHSIPSSHAPLTYVMGVTTAGRPVPDLQFTTFASGFSFVDTLNNQPLSSLRPPAIKVLQDHDE